MKRNLAAGLLLAGAVVGLASCKKSGPTGTAVPHALSSSATSSVHTISLPRYQANLPPGPGREQFAVACLTCHSARYITTQPPLTAAKWEESVRKMMKTYAAPIAEDQVQPIVQYIVAAKENGPPGSWETPVAVPAAMPVSLDLLGGDMAHGKKLYAQQCASCHGANGESNTPAAATMLPRPTDLTSGHYSKMKLAKAIVQGVPGTAMPGYPNNSGSDLSDLIAYTMTFAPPEQPAPPPANLADTQALYTKNCVSCHGTRGGGDGYAAPPLPRPPANFQAVRPTLSHATRVITDGVPGTAMPAWKSKLNDSQRAALAQYVRTLYQD
jgi:mono/diheme cytochrome c family protein